MSATVDNAKTIDQYTLLTDPQANDVLVIVAVRANTNAVTKSIQLGTLLGNTSANVVIQANTPANSTVTVKKGTIFFDDNYLYIATANNTLKRTALSSF